MGSWEMSIGENMDCSTGIDVGENPDVALMGNEVGVSIKGRGSGVCVNAGLNVGDMYSKKWPLSSDEGSNAGWLRG